VTATNRIALLKERHELLKAQRNGDAAPANGVGGGNGRGDLEVAAPQESPKKRVRRRPAATPQPRPRDAKPARKPRVVKRPARPADQDRGAVFVDFARAVQGLGGVAEAQRALDVLRNVQFC